MITLTFFAGMIALICLPVCAAIYIYKRQYKQQTIDYKKRREEEKHHDWLANMGLRETSFFFSTYGIRLFSIWSIRITAGGIFK